MITSRILLSAFSVLVVGLTACGSLGEEVSVGSDAVKGADGGETDGGGGSADGGTPCKAASDCGAGSWVCAYSATAQCGDYGVCISTAGQAQCAAYSPGCSCGTTPVNLTCNGIPSGYAVGPAVTAGACSSASDAGTCTSDADCGPSGACGFAIANSCTAAGQCYPKNTGALCNSFLPACACDGTTVNTVCEGFPTGVAAKPVAHAGACDGG